MSVGIKLTNGEVLTGDLVRPVGEDGKPIETAMTFLRVKKTLYSIAPSSIMYLMEPEAKK